MVKIIREIGFPSAVAGFVLWRIEQRLTELTRAITALTIRCTSCQPYDGKDRRTRGDLPATP